MEGGYACSRWQTKTWGPSEFTNRTVCSVKVKPLLSRGLGRGWYACSGWQPVRRVQLRYVYLVRAAAG